MIAQRWDGLGDVLARLSPFGQRADSFTFSIQVAAWSNHEASATTTLPLSGMLASLQALDRFDFTPASINAALETSATVAALSLDNSAAHARLPFGIDSTESPSMEFGRSLGAESYQPAQMSTCEVLSHASGLQVYRPHSFDLR